MRTFATWARSAGTLVACLAIGSASAQTPGDMNAVLSRVGDRVQDYFKRAQSIVCLERVLMQPIRADFTPEGFSRVLEYELRVEWDAGDGPNGRSEPRVMRQLLRVNGHAPAAKDENACMDPRSVSPEPLEMLLPENRGDFVFSWKGIGRLKNQTMFRVDYRSREAGRVTGTWKDDCLSISAPGHSRGRVWIDPATGDVMRLDEQLTGQLEYRIPPEHWGPDGPQTWVVERADSTTRYKRVPFHDPEETILLPESIESLTIFRAPAVSHRTTQTFSGYKRFMTGGRVLQ